MKHIPIKPIGGNTMTTLLSVPNATQTGIIKVKGQELGIRYVIADNIFYYALNDTMRYLEIKGVASALATKISAEYRGKHSICGSTPMYVVDLDGLQELIVITGGIEELPLWELIGHVYENFNTVKEENYIDGCACEEEDAYPLLDHRLELDVLANLFDDAYQNGDTKFMHLFFHQVANYLDQAHNAIEKMELAQN
ncbi:hypothetical protein [Bacillus sp. BP-3]|uniref:hypothetical protein n=1 Tax=Bacillus sp. BP-3 TaxID=3022773 RepID=UPI00232FBBDA|nr:hypothetical protein [Bacillus sp. BP-3]MDC2863997.1 hypothetical protein [Bacillus sp. BP-3]